MHAVVEVRAVAGYRAGGMHGAGVYCILQWLLSSVAADLLSGVVGCLLGPEPKYVPAVQPLPQSACPVHPATPHSVHPPAHYNSLQLSFYCFTTTQTLPSTQHTHVLAASCVCTLARSRSPRRCCCCPRWPRQRRRETVNVVYPRVSFRHTPHARPLVSVPRLPTPTPTPRPTWLVHIPILY